MKKQSKTFDGYKEAERVDTVIAAYLFRFPPDKNNIREWLKFSRTVSSSLHIIENLVLDKLQGLTQ